MTPNRTASGLTAFAPPPAATYRFVLSSMEAKLNIWLENLQSKKQWCTGFLDKEDYEAITNRIPNASIGDYVSLFKETLEYLMDDPKGESKNVSDAVASEKIRRRLIELEENTLKLELSVTIRALKSAWTTKYIFQLKPVSLERIDIVEAKLRDVEEELAWTKKCLAEVKTKVKHKDIVYLQTFSSNVEKLNDKGQIIWNKEKHNDFALTSKRDGIRVLVSGWYVVNLTVHLKPQSSGGKVELKKNGDKVKRSEVPYVGDRTSAALGGSMFFEKEDKLEVILTHAPLHVGADLTLLMVSE